MPEEHTFRLASVPQSLPDILELHTCSPSTSPEMDSSLVTTRTDVMWIQVATADATNWIYYSTTSVPDWYRCGWVWVFDR